MESALAEAGLCGRYQIIHVIFTQLPRVVALLSVFFMVFGGYDPGWTCLINTNYNSNGTNFSVFPLPEFGVEREDIKKKDSRMDVNVGNTSDVLNHRINEGRCDMIDLCQDGIHFNPHSNTIVTEFKLVCGRSWIIRAILFVTSVGILLGPFVGGPLGERFGRRVTLYASTAIVCLANFVAIFSTDWKLFACCFFVIGAAGNTILGTSLVFTFEFLTARWRGYFGSMPICSLSFCLFALMTSLLKDWVHVLGTIVFLGVVACAGFFIVPESPRWLSMNGYSRKAQASLRRIAKVNKRTLDSDSDFANVEQGAVRKGAYSIVDLLRNRQTCVVALKFSLIYFAICTTFQSIMFGIKSLPGDYYHNAIEASCTEAVVVLSVGHLCNRIGRRYTGFLFASVGAISSLSFTLVLSFVGTGNTSAIFLKIFSYMSRSSSECMSVVSGIFSAELIPTVVRNVATGLFRSSAGVGALVMPFLTPSKDNTSLTVSFAILCALYCVNAVLFLLFPETNEQHLTDSFNTQIGNNDEEDGNDNEHNDNVHESDE